MTSSKLSAIQSLAWSWTWVKSSTNFKISYHRRKVARSFPSRIPITTLRETFLLSTPELRWANPLVSIAWQSKSRRSLPSLHCLSPTKNSSNPWIYQQSAPSSHPSHYSAWILRYRSIVRQLGQFVTATKCCQMWQVAFEIQQHSSWLLSKEANVYQMARSSKSNARRLGHPSRWQEILTFPWSTSQRTARKLLAKTCGIWFKVAGFKWSLWSKKISMFCSPGTRHAGWWSTAIRWSTGLCTRSLLQTVTYNWLIASLTNTGWVSSKALIIHILKKSWSEVIQVCCIQSGWWFSLQSACCYRREKSAHRGSQTTHARIWGSRPISTRDISLNSLFHCREGRSRSKTSCINCGIKPATVPLSRRFGLPWRKLLGSSITRGTSGRKRALTKTSEQVSHHPYKIRMTRISSKVSPEMRLPPYSGSTLTDSRLRMWMLVRNRKTKRKEERAN